MIEINKTEVKFRGELSVIMSEMQFALIGLYDALKKFYGADGKEGDMRAFIAYMAVVDRATQLIFQKDMVADEEIKDAIEYKDALDAALDKIGYSKGRQVKQYFHNKCLDDYIKKGAKK